MGIILGNLIDVPVFLLFSILVLLLVLLLYSFLKQNQRMAELLLVLTLLVAGLFRFELLTRDFPLNHISHFAGLDRFFSVKGRIVDFPDVREDRTYLTMEVEKISNANREISSCGQILIRIKQPSFRFNYGDKISFNGYVNQPTNKRNPGAFDYRKYLSGKHIFGVVYLLQDRDIAILGRKGNLYYSGVIYPLRDWLLSLFGKTLSPLPSALMSGFLLGEVRNIPKSIYCMFRDTGTLHLLVVSGSNVGLIILFVLGILRFSKVPRVYATLITLVVIVVFANLVQNEPSVIRAGIMASAILVGLILYKKPDALNVISFAALLILFCSPTLLYDIGFQLSFASVLGIIYLVPRMSRFISRYIPLGKGSLWKWIIYPSIVSAAVEIAVLPILAYYFNFVPLITIASNLIIVPLASLSILLGCVIIFLGSFSYHLAGYVGQTANLVLNLTIYLLDFFAHLPISRIKVASPSLFSMFSYYFVLVLLPEASTSKKYTKILLFYLVVLASLSIWWFVLSANYGKVEFTFLDVGRGNAALLKAPEGKTILFDAGGVWADFDGGERIVVPYLAKYGIAKLDKIVLTDISETNLKSVQSIKNEVAVGNILNVFKDSLDGKAAEQIGFVPNQKQKSKKEEELAINFMRQEREGENKSQSDFVKVAYNQISFYLLGNGFYQITDSLSVIPDSCTVLVLSEMDIDIETAQNTIKLLKPKIVLLTSYDISKKRQGLVDQLESIFPKITFYSLRQNGAVIFKTDGKKIKTKLTIR